VELDYQGGSGIYGISYPPQETTFRISYDIRDLDFIEAVLADGFWDIAAEYHVIRRGLVEIHVKRSTVEGWYLWSAYAPLGSLSFNLLRSTISRVEVVNGRNLETAIVGCGVIESSTPDFEGGWRVY